MESCVWTLGPHMVAVFQNLRRWDLAAGGVSLGRVWGWALTIRGQPSFQSLSRDEEAPHHAEGKYSLKIPSFRYFVSIVRVATNVRRVETRREQEELGLQMVIKESIHLEGAAAIYTPSIGTLTGKVNIQTTEGKNGCWPSVWTSQLKSKRNVPAKTRTTLYNYHHHFTLTVRLSWKEALQCL